MRAIRCRFYRNGDSFFGGHQLPISVGRYGTLDNLYRELTATIGAPSLPSGVRQIFHVTGYLVTDLEQLTKGGSFVAAGNEGFKRLDYESILPPIVNMRRQGSKKFIKSESFRVGSRSESIANGKDFINARKGLIHKEKIVNSQGDFWFYNPKANLLQI